MGSLKLPHASGNSMSIAAPATNPASDLELKLPATVGTAGQVLKNSSTPGTLEFGDDSAGKILQVVYAKLDTAFTSTTLNGVDTGLSATINVGHVSNRLVIICSALWASEGNFCYMYLSDGSNNVIERPGASGSRGRFHWGTEYNGDAGSNFHYHASRDTFQCVTTPGSTGNYTVKLRADNSENQHAGRCVHLNRNVNNSDRYYDPIGISTLTVMEVAV